MTALPEPQLLQAPYPGLRPFTLDEAALFFGREPHVDQLLSKLQSSRFLSVLGPSGSGQLVQEFSGHQSSVFSVAFSSDGQRILTGSHDKTARLWEASSGQLVQEFSGHQSSVFSVALNPDGQRILTGSGDKTARLWRCEECAPLPVLLKLAEKRVTRQLADEERRFYLDEE